MSTIERLLTAEEYVRLPDNGEPTELVRGKVISMNVPNLRHGWLCIRIGRLVGNFVAERDLGYVMGNDAGMITERNPDTVRGADLSFFSYARIPKGAGLSCYAEVPPEIVVEVRSPRDRWPTILRRVSEFLAAGVLAVYVVDSEKETVTVLDAETDPPGRTLEGDDELTYPEPLGGLRIGVREIFS